jgi:hypothetical protein
MINNSGKKLAYHVDAKNELCVAGTGKDAMLARHGEVKSIVKEYRQEVQVLSILMNGTAYI